MHQLHVSTADPPHFLASTSHRQTINKIIQQQVTRGPSLSDLAWMFDQNSPGA